MYHYIIKQMVKKSFAALNRGDYESVLEGISPRIIHTFSGNHPIGGTRHSVESMRRWFKRMYTITPQLHFTIKNVVASGTPWNTTIAVEWEDTATPANGEPYVNEGVHIIKMRWGKVFYLHGYLDTALFSDLCKRLSLTGLPEASLPPIND
ncbi:nuclear transport factor 2 family protein [Arundinibacter roseus]|uniref:SnoaL-like domain-containing protein n=1 Tax=Arundinibacter roseus TaxID=2070510 RepID=A0A4R4KHA3_9BACT|nr:nuclear transport factor 2 family protein [Arundinibacter roseus]TDB67470.1 hypothetical protein EZE20_05855 [Arundinibacter roseus]